MRDVPTSTVQSTAGRALGPYRLLLRIGRGGMADVFLALAPAVGGERRRQVVIKQLRNDINDDEEFRAMFLDEGRLATRLAHPNIVKTLAATQLDHEQFLVMEFLDGQPLSRVRRRAMARGGVPLAVHLRVLADALHGIHYLHELCDDDGRSLCIVHRDVTPQNVFITYDGTVKVVDFGIAKATSSAAETRVGVVKGKLAYMSPETLRGEQVDRRADVFSIGVMLWEAVTGARFWGDQDEVTVFRRLVAGDLPMGGPLERRIDPLLMRVIARAIAPRREERFATAAEMRAEMETLIHSFGRLASAESLATHMRAVFAADREIFHEQVHAELVKLDAERGSSPVSARSRHVEHPEIAAAPLSSSSPGTLRTAMTSSQDVVPASTRVGVKAVLRPQVWVTAAVIGSLVITTLAIRRPVLGRLTGAGVDPASSGQPPLPAPSQHAQMGPRARVIAGADGGERDAASETPAIVSPPLVAAESILSSPLPDVRSPAPALPSHPNLPSFRRRPPLDRGDPWAE